MSLENHPNFHAVKFATDVTSSFYDSLRGGSFELLKQDPHSFDEVNEIVKNEIADFVNRTEELVDRNCEGRK